MNVLVLRGSLRPESTNRQLANAAVAHLPESARVHVGTLPAGLPFYDESLDTDERRPAVVECLPGGGRRGGRHHRRHAGIQRLGFRCREERLGLGLAPRGAALQPDHLAQGLLEPGRQARGDGAPPRGPARR